MTRRRKKRRSPLFVLVPKKASPFAVCEIRDVFRQLICHSHTHTDAHTELLSISFSNGFFLPPSMADSANRVLSETSASIK